MAIHHALDNVTCKHATSEGMKIRKLHDGGGLYLCVYADSRKYWRLRYKISGKEKSISIGVFPKIGLKQARENAQLEREKLDKHLDPSIERRIKKQQSKEAADNSLEVVAREWYAKQLNTWAPSHAKDVLRRLEVNVFPYLGKLPIKKIEAPELLNTVRIIEQRGAYDLAHRVLQVCSQVFRYGVATGRCSRDPAIDLRGALTPHKKKNQAAVKPEELPELLRSISQYETIGVNRHS